MWTKQKGSWTTWKFKKKLMEKETDAVDEYDAFEDFLNYENEENFVEDVDAWDLSEFTGDDIPENHPNQESVSLQAILIFFRLHLRSHYLG